MENKHERGFPTIPRQENVNIPQDEYLSLKNTLDRLIEELSAVESMKDMYNEVVDNDVKRDEQFKREFVQYFQVFSEKTDKMMDNFSKEFDYVSSLQEKVRNNELSRQVYLLEQQLQNEKAEIGIMLNKIDGCVGRINEHMERESMMFEEKISKLQQAIEEKIELMEQRITELQSDIEQKITVYNDVDGKLDKSLEDFQHTNNEKIADTVNSVTAFTKKQTDDAVGKIKELSQKTFDEIKSKTIDFMKQCSEMSQKEATKAAKHMMNQGRFDRKDKIIIIMCGIIIINELFTMIPSIIGNFAK